MSDQKNSLKIGGNVAGMNVNQGDRASQTIGKPKDTSTKALLLNVAKAIGAVAVLGAALMQVDAVKAWVAALFK
jgi:hypothetical protein